MRRKRILVSMLFTIFFANMMPFVIHVSAQQTTKLLIEPPSIIDESLTPCNNITLTVQVSDVTNLYGYEFEIYYRSTVLIAMEVLRPPGHFLEPTDPYGQFVAKWEIRNDFNATHGRIWLGFTLLAPETARSGSGTLVEITFHIESISSTPIALKDTKLADNTGSPIVHDAENGYFSNSPPPEPPLPAEIYVEPEKLVDPTLIPCENFTLNVSIVNATDVYALEFRLGFNGSLVEALEVQEGSFLRDVGATSILGTEINNIEGYIWFAVTLLSPPGANGNGPLATILFHVINNGTTLLTLYETSLTDSTGQPLSHTTKNGYFANVIPPVIHDVAVIYVAPSKPMVYEGWTVNITVVAKNEGEVSETFNVTAFYDSIAVDTLTVTDLASGENTTIIFQWNTQGLPVCQNYTIKAEAEPVLYETDLSDNVLIDGTVKIKLMGDINGDGIVDIYDLATLAVAFGSSPGAPNWDLEADLDQNDIVDLFDIMEILLNYGWAC